MSLNGILMEGKNIRRTFKTGKTELEVLKGINIVLERNKIHTIVGPSGAGKSTLLHILGGLDKPTGGKVVLDNKSMYDFPDKELARIRNKDIGFIFQFHHLLPEFTALENVMMPAAIDGMGERKAQERAKNLLERVGLLERIGHKPSELSGGEKQRVAVARALVNNPLVIFADEPTGNLDRKNSDLLLSMLLELNRSEGITLVVVTHNDEIAKKVGNIIRMEDGKIEGVQNDV